MYEKNSDYLDTGKVEKMIKQNIIPDYSKIKDDFSSNNLAYIYVDTIEGCNVYLKNDEGVNFSQNQYFNLKFIEVNSKSDIVNAQCNTINKVNGQITCHINNNANNIYYISQDNTIKEEDKYIIISSSNKNSNNFNIKCVQNSKKSKKTLIIIILILGSIIFIGAISLIIFIIKKKGRKKESNYSYQKKQYNSGDKSNDFIF